MQEIIIVAGPNGAGKTTFASQYFQDEGEALFFLNADEIGREIEDDRLTSAAKSMRAGRIMLARINWLIEERASFVFETTLASRMYALKIPHWRSLGYKVILLYLRLPSIQHSLTRVKKRVAAGGHDIPEDAIKRRFPKSLEYLETTYKPLVDEWYIWDSRDDGTFVFSEGWDLS